MAAKSRRVKTLNVNYPKGEGGTSIDAALYEATKAAILRAVPPGRDGVTFKELVTRVKSLVSRQPVFAGRSVSWYVTTVKLDLEARGLICRVAGTRPQRLVRGRSSAAPRR